MSTATTPLGRSSRRSVLFALGTVSALFLPFLFYAYDLPAQRQLPFGFPLPSAHTTRELARASANLVEPRWDDFDRVSARTRKYDGVVAPFLLRHLEQYKAPEPYREVYAYSAFLDTRPVIVQSPTPLLPQIALLAALHTPSTAFANCPLKCFVVVKRKGVVRSFTSPATLDAMPDGHESGKELVAAIFNCAFEGEWEDSEIFVTVSFAGIPPPSDVFLPVQALPTLDPDHHRQANGTAAVCLPPLRGDDYAPFIADFVAYYKVLGFSKIYAYILDPGPETLKVIRRVSDADATLQPIRWAVHQSFKHSTTDQHKPFRNFLVDPDLWNVPAIATLDDDDEFEMGGVVSHERDFRMWYYGQSAAQHDCLFRSMKDGHRWLLSGDWDEFLLMKPANGDVWPPPASSPFSTPISDWARSVDQKPQNPRSLQPSTAAQAGVSVESVTQGLLPAAFLFRSSFSCMRCAPTEPPHRTPAILAIESRFPAVDWLKPGAGFPLSIVSPVRSEQWWRAALRTKSFVNPWAWRTLSIHFPGLGYAEWALWQKFCNTGSVNATQCATGLLATFGRDTTVVSPPSPSNGDSDSLLAPSTRGVGGLYHYRVDSSFAKSMSQYNEHAAQQPVDILQGPQATEFLLDHRVNGSDWAGQFKEKGTQTIHDWNLLETMGLALLGVLDQKSRRGPLDWVYHLPDKNESSGVMEGMVAATAMMFAMLVLKEVWPGEVSDAISLE